MAEVLTTTECGSFCKEETEFSLKFVITSLTLNDSDSDNGFEEILIVITLDGNVIKISDIEADENGEMKLVGHELLLQLSPEALAQKLLHSPIMLNISRGCDDLGSAKLEVMDCFASAVKCEEFSSETSAANLMFVKDDEENAEMKLVFQVSRILGNQVIGKHLKKNPANEKEKIEDENADAENISSCSDGNSAFSFSVNSDSYEAQDQQSSDQNSSSKSTRSKCCSDIAKSLDVKNYADSQKTVCNGCGGVSVSGITCDNKKIFSDIEALENIIKSNEKTVQNSSSDVTVISNEKCKSPVVRICSECFEDLSKLPKNSSCPTCVDRAKLERKMVMVDDECESNENHKVKSCIKSIFEDIFYETKDKLVNDWKRLSCVNKKTKGEKKRCKIKSSKKNEK
jgi:hypothetical protein